MRGLGLVLGLLLGLVLSGEVLLVSMVLLLGRWGVLIRMLRLVVLLTSLVISSGEEVGHHLLELLHEHGHLFILLLPGGLVLLLHGDALGT
jgi:hypothetical protein